MTGELDTDTQKGGHVQTDRDVMQRRPKKRRSPRGWGRQRAPPDSLWGAQPCWLCSLALRTVRGGASAGLTGLGGTLSWQPQETDLGGFLEEGAPEGSPGGAAVTCQAAGTKASGQGDRPEQRLRGLRAPAHPCRCPASGQGLGGARGKGPPWGAAGGGSGFRHTSG